MRGARSKCRRRKARVVMNNCSKFLSPDSTQSKLQSDLRFDEPGNRGAWNVARRSRNQRGWRMEKLGGFLAKGRDEAATKKDGWIYQGLGCRFRFWSGQLVDVFGGGVEHGTRGRARSPGPEQI